MFGPKCPDHFEQAAKLGTNEMSGLVEPALYRGAGSFLVAGGCAPQIFHPLGNRGNYGLRPIAVAH
jgi:hypothetical protein